MADDIALNRAQRTTLFSLQQIERDAGVSQRRLSFGRKIVDVTDGATQFFQARGLTNRLSDIRDRGEQIDQAISALQTFVGGAQSLQELLDIARGHVLRAEGNLEAAGAQTRQSITRDFREALRNFFETANSLQYNGLNLLVDQTVASRCALATVPAIGWSCKGETYLKVVLTRSTRATCSAEMSSPPTGSLGLPLRSWIWTLWIMTLPTPAVVLRTRS